MREEDEDKTAFITPYGVYCYTTMPFGLKNAGATYQRMMQDCFKKQIGRNVQVYVDDIASPQGRKTHYSMTCKRRSQTSNASTSSSTRRSARLACQPGNSLGI